MVGDGRTDRALYAQSSHVMPNDLKVTRNEQEHQFEISMDGHVSLLRYRETAHRIVLIHTEVPPELQGKGLGAALTRAALEYAREHHLKVAPHCPFAATYIEKHPEYADLVEG